MMQILEEIDVGGVGRPDVDRADPLRARRPTSPRASTSSSSSRRERRRQGRREGRRRRRRRRQRRPRHEDHRRRSHELARHRRDRARVPAHPRVHQAARRAADRARARSTSCRSSTPTPWSSRKTLNEHHHGRGAAGGSGGGAARRRRPATRRRRSSRARVKVSADKATNSIVVTSSLRDFAHAPRGRRSARSAAPPGVHRGGHHGPLRRAAEPARRELPRRRPEHDLGIGGGQSLLYGGLNPLDDRAAQPRSDRSSRPRARRARAGHPGHARTSRSRASPSPRSASHQRAGEHRRHRHPLDAAHPRDRQHQGRDQRRPEHPAPDQHRVRPARRPRRAARAAPRARSARSARSGRLRRVAAPRQDVGTKVTITPHLNDSTRCASSSHEEISEAGRRRSARSASFRSRSAPRTTQLVVKDQQTVVIGGLMRNRVAHQRRRSRCSATSRVLGALFRSDAANTLQKSNLILVLTPYIIREQIDLRTIFERKMQERQEFLDRYFVFSERPRLQAAARTTRARTGLLEDIRQSYRDVDEQRAPRGAHAPARHHRPRAGRAARAAASLRSTRRRRRRRRRAATGAPAHRRRARPRAREHQRHPPPARRRREAWSSEPMARSSASSASSSSRRGARRRRQARAALRRAEASAASISSTCSSTERSPTRSRSRARSPTRRSSRSSTRSIPSEIPTALATRMPITFAKSHRIARRAPRTSRACTCSAPIRSTRSAARRPARPLRKPVEASVAPAREDRGRHQPRLRARGRRRASSRRDDARSHEDEGASDILDSDDEAPVIRWVNSLFLQAMKERASDIHIEPEEKEVIVRYRIDGELYVARRAPRTFMNSIVSRIKIESALNIAEKRLPAGRTHHEEDRRQGLRHPRLAPSRRAAATSASSCAS